MKIYERNHVVILKDGKNYWLRIEDTLSSNELAVTKQELNDLKILLEEL